jgi:hypothetical protein
MAKLCDTARFALRAAELTRLARQLGYMHLARRLARYPGGIAPRHFARHLAEAAASAYHAPHATGPCHRAGRLGTSHVMLLTIPDGQRHVIRSVRHLRGAAEEDEALFDTVVG